MLSNTGPAPPDLASGAIACFWIFPVKTDAVSAKIIALQCSSLLEDGSNHKRMQ